MDDSLCENLVSELSASEIRAQNRLKSLKFLLFYLKMAAPNISHLLLGFNIHKSLKNQAFYAAGTKIEASKEILTIVPRNCLHSIIGIIVKFLADPSIITHSASTVDHCYEILFILCSNTQYNQELLNFLRTEYDFFCLNLKKIPFRLSFAKKASEGNETANNYGQDDEADLLNEANDLSESPVSLYSEYSWIIKLVCLEIQSLISHRMKSKLKKIIYSLVETVSATDSNVSALALGANTSVANAGANFSNLIFGGGGSGVGANVSTSVFSNYQNRSDNKTLLDATGFNATLNDFTEKPSKLNSLITSSTFTQMHPDMLNLNFFDEQLIEKVIESCKYNSAEFYSFLASNLQLYDLKRIKQILINEIKNSGELYKL